MADATDRSATEGRPETRQVLSDFQTALADRALIDQALGVLAERLGISIAEAAHALTHHASESGEGLVPTARAVLDGLVLRPRPVDVAEVARTALVTTCAWAGLDPRDARVIRKVGNVVFQLAHDPVIVKIVPTPALAHRAGNAVSAARLLARHGVPVIRLWPGIEQPLSVNGCAVTLWQYEQPAQRDATIAELADLLLRLHDIPVAGADLPAWNPFPDIRRRVELAEDSEDIGFLTSLCDSLESGLVSVRFALPTVVLHGDAHLGNLIPLADKALWCDLDSSAVGPAEWDLIPVAVGQLRFPGVADRHAQLARAYGFDVTRWDGFPVLRGIRELKLVTSALPNVRGNPVVHAEVRRRLGSLRTGDTSVLWNRYP